jgi:uncharacterized protein (DUF1778 family)
MKRGKSKAQQKGEMIRVRVTREQKRLLMDAANAQDLDLSAWLRSVGLREARRALGLHADTETETP